MSNSRPFDKGILETFLKNSYVVVGFIDEIGKATSVMRHLCGRSMHAPGVEEMQEVCTDVKRCLASARENAKKATVRELCPRPWIGDHKLCSMLQRGVCVRVLEVCQEDLSRMKNVKDRMEKEHGANDRTLEVFTMHYNRLVTKFVNALKEHQLMKQQLNASQTAMVAKRARVFFPEASDAEIQKQIALNPLGYARDALLFSTQEAAHQDVHILVAEVQSRAQDVEMLSASISEVQDMFRDFTVLIADQHEDIDTISDTVEEACARVQNGNTEMQRAICEQRKARKRMCCLATCAIVILIVIAVTAGAMVR